MSSDIEITGYEDQPPSPERVDLMEVKLSKDLCSSSPGISPGPSGSSSPRPVYDIVTKNEPAAAILYLPKNSVRMPLILQEVSNFHKTRTKRCVYPPKFRKVRIEKSEKFMNFEKIYGIDTLNGESLWKLGIILECN